MDYKNRLIILIVIVSFLGLFYLFFNETFMNENNVNKSYSIGDQISFHNEQWYVIKDSKSTDDYVVVIKATNLSSLNGKTYYECPIEDDNGINCSMKMSNDYRDSAIKKYFDETYIDLLGRENLKEIDKHYIRLITIEELKDLGCNIDNKSCENSPSWLLSNSRFWTMSHTTEVPTMDASEANVYSFGKDEYGTDIGINGVGSTLNVRPVINLLKSSII